MTRFKKLLELHFYDVKTLRPIKNMFTSFHSLFLDFSGDASFSLLFILIQIEVYERQK